MIRRMLVASAAVLSLALAAPLTANAQSIYILAGASIPTGDYSDFADTGWLGAGGVTFPIGEAGLWAGAEALYGQNSFSSDVVDENFKLFSVMGLLGYDIPTESSLTPYVWGGAGLMTLSNGDSESGFGFQFGGGVAFEVTATSRRSSKDDFRAPASATGSPTRRSARSGWKRAFPSGSAATTDPSGTV